MKPEFKVGMGLTSALSLVLGIGLGRWLLGGDRVAAPAQAPAASARDSAELLAVLRGIERNTEALARALESLPLPSLAENPAPQRELSGDAPPAHRGELAEALLALSDAVRDLRDGKRAVENSAMVRLDTPAWVDRDAVFLATGLRRAALTNADELESAVRAFRTRHLFMSNQEVLSTYGAPDSIVVRETTRQWTYENRFEGGSEHFGFAFDDGTVFEAWYNCYPQR